MHISMPIIMNIMHMRISNVPIMPIIMHICMQIVMPSMRIMTMMMMMIMMMILHDDDDNDDDDRGHERGVRARRSCDNACK